MSDPLTHAQLDQISQQLRSSGGANANAQAEYQRLSQQIQSGGVPDALTHAKLLAINQQLQQPRPQQPMQASTAPPGWQAPSEPPPSFWDAPWAVLALTGGLGWFLLPVEALGAALLTWVYVGSAKGLNMRMPDGSVIGGLHWDPFLAAVLSLAVGAAWVLLFLVPVAGPLVGLAMSAIWGLAAYLGTGSLAFGIFAFVASMLARMFMRTTRRRWLAVVEWSVVAIAALIALAPIGQALPLPGLGGWEALRQMYRNGQ